VLRILIHALGADSPGARRHLSGFLPALREAGGAHRLTLDVRRSAAEALAPLSGGPIELWPFADALVRPAPVRLLVDLVLVPLGVRRRGFDLLVTLANFGPVWSPVPHVVFQRNALHFTPDHLRRLGGARRIESRLRTWLLVAEMRHATVTVTATDAMAALIRRSHPFLADRRFHTLPFGVDLARFARVEARETAGPFVFLYPAKIEAYKGLEVLLEATRRLAARHDGFEVHVTTADRGWPRDIQTLVDASRGQPWFGRLRFVGAQPAEHMPETYRAADAVIYPSLCESFGFPLLEAMACGLPIVAGATEVNRELCAGAARYYPVESAADCADAMQRVLDDRELRASLRQASRSRIAERDWSWTTYARAFVELCESVGRRTAPPARR
jgi:glycosyltransferase involved in cell wall biosynthesis